MRVLLIHPFCPLEEMPSPPLSIGYLAAALERIDVEVNVLDFAVSPYSKERLRDFFQSFQPHIIGATCVTMTFHKAIQVLTDAKAIDPNITTIMGGPHISFCTSDTMQKYPALDVAVIGEGDDTIVELVQCLEKGDRLQAVEGIAYRKDGHVHQTPYRPPSIDVDTLPFPARHLLDLSKYKALGAPITMTTSRGCPFQCIFCVGRKMVGAKVRYRNTKSVVDEFEYLSQLGFRQINIADDLFTANKKHCVAICNEILARNIQTKWTSFARVGTISLRVLKKMKEAGCYAVSFGFESADSQILKRVRKGITTEQMVEAVKLCIEAGIIPHGSFILGLPGETPQTMRRTIEFGDLLDEMGAMVGSHLLAPFPGTKVREESESYGLNIITNDWSLYHANRAVVETNTVSKSMFDAHAIEVEEKVAQQYQTICDHVLQNVATEEETERYVALERMGFFYHLMMNQVIENHGICTGIFQPSSRTDILTEMSKKTAAATPFSLEESYRQLDYAAENDILRYKQSDRGITWEWRRAKELRID